MLVLFPSSNFSDQAGSHFKLNPTAIAIAHMEVTKGMKQEIVLKAGVGFAVSLMVREGWGDKIGRSFVQLSLTNAEYTALRALIILYFCKKRYYATHF